MKQALVSNAGEGYFNRFTRSYVAFFWWVDINRRATRARPLLVVDDPKARFEAEAAKSDHKSLHEDSIKIFYCKNVSSVYSTARGPNLL